MAAVFLAWFLPRGAIRIASGLAALEIAGILLFTGIDLITFRDIGLLGAALALFFLSAARASLLVFSSSFWFQLSVLSFSFPAYGCT